MRNGVTLIDPVHAYVSADAEIGQDTVIYPGAMIFDDVKIGAECTIGPNAEIKDSAIGRGTVVKQSVVHDSEIGNNVNIGPFAHI